MVKWSEVLQARDSNVTRISSDTISPFNIADTSSSKYASLLQESKRKKDPSRLKLLLLLLFSSPFFVLQQFPISLHFIIGFFLHFSIHGWNMFMALNVVFPPQRFLHLLLAPSTLLFRVFDAVKDFLAINKYYTFIISIDNNQSKLHENM